MSMQSLALLPELENLPVAEDAVDLGFTDTATRLRGMDKDHFAVELAEGVDETIEPLFNAVPNVPDELMEAHELLYPDSELSLHEHYQEMVERGDSSVTGFVSNLKGKVAELEAEQLLESRFSGYDFSLADKLNQPGWDLRGVNPDGEEILVQVKMGSANYAYDALDRMQDSPDTYFAVSQEIYQKISESSPELSAQLIHSGESNLEFTQEVSEGLGLLASNEGFDIPDGIGDILPYAGEIILGIRLVLDIVSTERDFKDVQLADRSRVHALKALVLMSKFGVTTVFTTAGGAAGSAAGTALFPGVGTAVGGIAGSIGGAGTAALLNRRLQPHMMEVGMVIARVDEDDMFYFRNKRVIDDIGASLAATKAF